MNPTPEVSYSYLPPFEVHTVVGIIFTLRFSLALSACIGCTFLFSSVACFIFSSLAFLLALEGLHPLKLDEVGLLPHFKAGGGLAIGLVPSFCFARWLAHSRAVPIVSAAGDLFAGLYWWPCKTLSCSSGHIWRLDENIFVGLFWWRDACSLGLLPCCRPGVVAWRVPWLAWVAVPPFVAVLVLRRLILGLLGHIRWRVRVRF